MIITVALHFQKGYFYLYYGGRFLKNKYIYLTEEFYKDYKNCSEILSKKDRPYSMLQIEINNVTWAIPLRSDAKHNNVIWTDKKNNCGLDLSKAVVIEDKKYISKKDPIIRQNEFNELKGKDHIVYKKMKKYIDIYVKAYTNQHIERNKKICKYSALQYFHEYIPSLKELSADNEVAFTK